MSSEPTIRPLTLITGANSGIGYGTALGMARRGYRVVMLCRSRDKGEAARQSIVDQTGNESVDLMLCDLSLQAQIRAFSAEFQDRYAQLDVLINNAALIPPRHTETEDGIEYQWQVNVLAPFMLTLLLMDLLKASAPARILNVTSNMHFVGSLDLDDPGGQQYGLMGYGQYANTKFADMVFTLELSRRLAGTGVTTYGVHPGVIGTRLARALPVAGTLYRWLLPGPEFGARTSIYCATEPGIEGLSGEYFARARRAEMSPRARDATLGARLWAVSGEMTGLADGSISRPNRNASPEGS